ncbi:MAG: ATP-binding domain-containing protein [Myxococcaceae bacterium]|nr:ATP-binding domain-containing protein [Myxococcaceae bacterium]
MSTLAPELQRLVDEEEALLKRTLAALESARRRARQGPAVPLLAEELGLLKEEAATANPADLPHLFNQMDLVSAVVDRAGTRTFANPQSPYFAHLQVNGPAGVRDYLLGRDTFTDAAADVRIIDWRTAPLARVFYNYQEGDDYEETFGDRLTHGDVLIRRLVVIERGVLTGIRRGRQSLQRQADGQWVDASAQTALGGGAGKAVRSGSLGVGKGASASSGFDITAQLDKDQYAAMSVGAREPLLVLGSAGSGKTTVALHRLALLAARELANVPRTRLQVVVPEEGLARLSRRLLAPLGLEKVPVKTQSRWALDTARAVFREKDLEAFEDAPPLVTRLKRHPALATALKTHPAVAKKSSSFSSLRRQLAEAFTDRELLQRVVTAANGDLPTTAIEETVQHTMLQMSSAFSEGELAGFDSDATTTIDGKGLNEGTPEALAGTIDVEDFPILMALLAERQRPDVESTAHLVLDEAEDFSVFELFVLGRLLSKEKSCTVAGDEMQQTTTSFPGWPEVLQTLGVPKAEQVRLKVSYRCPRPIAELAREVLGSQAAGLEAGADARDAVPVGFHHFPNFDQASLFLRDELQDLIEREPRASVAVIASSSDAADTIYKGLAGLQKVRRVVEGQYTFEPGIDVTDADEVKGLEWDYVVLPDVTARAYPVDDEARRRLHVAVTRAAHQLWVLSYDLRSRLLPK